MGDRRGDHQIVRKRPELESFTMNKNYVPSRGSGNREAVAMKQGAL